MRSVMCSGVWVHLHVFPLISKGKQFLWFPVCFPMQLNHSRKGSTHKGKNFSEKSHMQKSQSWILWKSTHSPKIIISVKLWPVIYKAIKHFQHTQQSSCSYISITFYYFKVACSTGYCSEVHGTQWLSLS